MGIATAFMSIILGYIFIMHAEYEKFKKSAVVLMVIEYLVGSMMFLIGESALGVMFSMVFPYPLWVLTTSEKEVKSRCQKKGR